MDFEDPLTLVQSSDQGWDVQEAGGSRAVSYKTDAAGCVWPLEIPLEAAINAAEVDGYQVSTPGQVFALVTAVRFRVGVYSLASWRSHWRRLTMPLKWMAIR